MTSNTPAPRRLAAACIPGLILLSLSALWIVFIATNAPRMGGVDAFIFRDPGCNCARGAGLVSDSVPHDAFEFPPRLFASYTPGDPLLFSLATRLLGCDSYADTFYELCIALWIAGLLSILFLRRAHSARGRFFAVLIAGIYLPTDLFLIGHDRPEWLAIAAFAPLLFLWVGPFGPVARIAALAGSGLVFLIDPFAGLIAWMILIFLLASEQPAKPRAQIALGGSLMAVGIVAACAVYMHHVDASVISRFLNQAFGIGTGVGVVIHGKTDVLQQGGANSRYAGALHAVFSMENPLNGLALVETLGIMVMIFLYIFRFGTKDRRSGDLREFAILFCILFLFPIVVFPKQPNYFAFSSAVLLFMIFLGSGPLLSRLSLSRLPWLVLFLMAALALPSLAIETLKSVETRQSYTEAEGQARRVSKLFATAGSPQPRLLVDAGHLFLYKPFFSNLYDVSYLAPSASIADFDGLVLCYSATKAFAPSQMQWRAPFKPQDWSLVDTDDAPVVITLGGRRLMRRNWSWGCDVYKRAR